MHRCNYLFSIAIKVEFICQRYASERRTAVQHDDKRNVHTFSIFQYIANSEYFVDGARNENESLEELFDFYEVQAIVGI